MIGAALWALASLAIAFWLALVIREIRTLLDPAPAPAGKGIPDGVVPGFC